MGYRGLVGHGSIAEALAGDWLSAAFETAGGGHRGPGRASLAPLARGASSPVMKGRAVMVCGTTSGAGKSFLTTALARWYARQGLKVAPFKSQNMSNNARVAAGGEMGSAQYLQALAARAVPDVRMNPILLKPERDTASQVILLGQRRDDLARMEWRARATAPVADGEVLVSTSCSTAMTSS